MSCFVMRKWKKAEDEWTDQIPTERLSLVSCGIKNEGNSCFFNCLIQILYHSSPSFRVAVLTFDELSPSCKPRSILRKASDAGSVTSDRSRKSSVHFSPSVGRCSSDDDAVSCESYRSYSRNPINPPIFNPNLPQFLYPEHLNHQTDNLYPYQNQRKLYEFSDPALNNGLPCYPPSSQYQYQNWQERRPSIPAPQPIVGPIVDPNTTIYRGNIGDQEGGILSPHNQRRFSIYNSHQNSPVHQTPISGRLSETQTHHCSPLSPYNSYPSNTYHHNQYVPYQSYTSVNPQYPIIKPKTNEFYSFPGTSRQRSISRPVSHSIINNLGSQFNQFESIQRGESRGRLAGFELNTPKPRERSQSIQCTNPISLSRGRSHTRGISPYLREPSTSPLAGHCKGWQSELNIQSPIKYKSDPLSQTSDILSSQQQGPSKINIAGGYLSRYSEYNQQQAFSSPNGFDSPNHQTCFNASSQHAAFRRPGGNPSLNKPTANNPPQKQKTTTNSSSKKRTGTPLKSTPQLWLDHVDKERKKPHEASILSVDSLDDFDTERKMNQSNVFLQLKYIFLQLFLSLKPCIEVSHLYKTVMGNDSQPQDVNEIRDRLYRMLSNCLAEMFSESAKGMKATMQRTFSSIGRGRSSPRGNGGGFMDFYQLNFHITEDCHLEALMELAAAETKKKVKSDIPEILWINLNRGKKLNPKGFYGLSHPSNGMEGKCFFPAEISVDGLLSNDKPGVVRSQSLRCGIHGVVSRLQKCKSTLQKAREKPMNESNSCVVSILMEKEQGLERELKTIKDDLRRQQIADGLLYELRAVIVYRETGHYWCYIRFESQGYLWYRIEDGDVCVMTYENMYQDSIGPPVHEKRLTMDACERLFFGERFSASHYVEYVKEFVKFNQLEKSCHIFKEDHPQQPKNDTSAYSLIYGCCNFQLSDGCVWKPERERLHARYPKGLRDFESNFWNALTDATKPHVVQYIQEGNESLMREILSAIVNKYTQERAKQKASQETSADPLAVDFQAVQLLLLSWISYFPGPPYLLPSPYKELVEKLSYSMFQKTEKEYELNPIVIFNRDYWKAFYKRKATK